MTKSLGASLLGENMMQTQRIAILVPLAVGGVAVICTIMIHALPLSATVNFVRREKRLGHVGRVVRDLRRISGFRNRLLPLDGQLHLFGLRRRDYVAFLEIAGAVGNGEWNAPVRGFDRDDFCGHSTVDSGQICGSEGVTGEQEI